jgi:hypothetical protein
MKELILFLTTPILGVGVVCGFIVAALKFGFLAGMSWWCELSTARKPGSRGPSFFK